MGIAYSGFYKWRNSLCCQNDHPLLNLLATNNPVIGQPYTNHLVDPGDSILVQSPKEHLSIGGISRAAKILQVALERLSRGCSLPPNAKILSVVRRPSPPQAEQVDLIGISDIGTSLKQKIPPNKTRWVGLDGVLYTSTVLHLQRHAAALKMPGYPRQRFKGCYSIVIPPRFTLTPIYPHTLP